MLKINHFIKQSWLLIISSFCFGLLIAVTNAALSPRIEQNKIDKLNRLMTGLLPQGQAFEKSEELEITSAKGKVIISNVYKALTDSNDCAGWAFNAIGSGFADKIEIVIGVDTNFEKITGFAVLSSNETPGFGDRIKTAPFRDQFAGAPADELKLSKTGDPSVKDYQIIALTGATVSSDAVVNIVNNFLTQVKTQMKENGSINNGK